MLVKSNKRARRFIQRTSPLPVYLQVAGFLERDLQRNGISKEKIALPSENELAAEFSVSRVTIRQALDELHNKGLIYREKGRGSYVRSQHIVGVTGFGSFTSEVGNSGAVPSSRFIDFLKVDSLPPGMKRHLRHTPEVSSAFYKLTRVRCIDDRAVAYEETYLPTEIYPEISKADVESGSLYAAMRQLWGYEPAWADAAIEPAIADAAVAKHLGIKSGAPVVVAWRVTSSEHDDVLEYVRAIYCGEDFALTVRRHKIG